MTIKHLEVFVTVCKTMNMTRAANELNMTQPAVTRSIKELEQYYQVRLFERLNKRIYLTETGRAVYAQAVQIIADFNEMEEALLTRGERRILRVGGNYKMGTSLLPKLIAAFSEKNPAAEVRVRIFNHTKLEDFVCDNELDLAFVEGYASNPDIHYEKLGNEKMELVFAPSYPLKEKGRIYMKDLVECRILSREEGSAARKWMDNVFASHSMTLTPLWESASVDALIQAAVEGIGVAILPKTLVEEKVKKGLLLTRNVCDEDFLQDNYIIWHKNKHLTADAQALIALSREFISHLV